MADVNTSAATAYVGMGPSYMRREVRKALPEWTMIDDVLQGETQIKYRRQKYLPVPNGSDTTPTNLQRYNDYLIRAQFYNFTERTLQGLVGQVFVRDPQITLPRSLETLKVDATGMGIELKQLAKMAVSDGLSKGRAGLYVDYPTIENGATAADLASGNIRPTIQKIEAKDIINWRWTTTGGKKVLSLVVFNDPYIVEDDSFGLTIKIQQRELRLESGGYVIRLWRDSLQNPYRSMYPKDSSGARLQSIPFSFIGSQNNDPDIDPAPLFSLASLNIGHYRNSADYEESVFMLGQPTVYFSGLQEEWVKNVLGDTVYIGARKILPLPVGAAAGLLQVSPNTLAFEAMKHKESQAVALGARLVQNKSVQRTAFEADIDNASEMSTLSSVASNVGTAFTNALKWAALFTGDNPDTIKYDLNSSFDLVNLSSDERLQLIKEWQSGAISYPEMRNNLRRAGIASETDDPTTFAKIIEELKKLRAVTAPAPNNDSTTGDPTT